MKSTWLKIISLAAVIGLICIAAFRKQTIILLNPSGTTVSTRFLVPAGFTRIVSVSGSFGEYLQNIPLKPNGTLVHYYDGEEKPNKVAAAVLNVDVGSKDLQQCADAVMRLRAEYLFKVKQYSALHFNFTNGFKADYSKWRAGNRIHVKGNTVSWVKTTKESTSYESFREYMNMVFTYAGTASLSKELISVPFSDMQIGDVLIRGGSPGHAVIVIDKAVNPKTNKQLFMIAQSYMPAQDIHILINKNKTAISPWYELDAATEDINTPEWPFKTDELKRFY
ncbi:MAG: DUF4846 domain-containing protein [Bacteroidota bacterium]